MADTIQRGMRHRDGTKVGSQRKVVKADSLADWVPAEVEWAKTYAIFLKASSFSYSYISDSLGIQKKIVRAWFDDEEIRAKVHAIQADMAEGAIKLLKHHSVELGEMLLELARHSKDDKVRLAAIESGFDRLGIAKVSKSESLTRKVDEGGETAKAQVEFLEKIADLPMEKQQELARLSSQMVAASTEQPEDIDA